MNSYKLISIETVSLPCWLPAGRGGRPASKRAPQLSVPCPPGCQRGRSEEMAPAQPARRARPLGGSRSANVGRRVRNAEAAPSPSPSRRAAFAARGARPLPGAPRRSIAGMGTVGVKTTSFVFRPRDSARSPRLGGALSRALRAGGLIRRPIERLQESSAASRRRPPARPSPGHACPSPGPARPWPAPPRAGRSPVCRAGALGPKMRAARERNRRLPRTEAKAREEADALPEASRRERARVVNRGEGTIGRRASPQPRIGVRPRAMNPFARHVTARARKFLIVPHENPVPAKPRACLRGLGGWCFGWSSSSWKPRPPAHRDPRPRGAVAWASPCPGWWPLGVR